MNMSKYAFLFISPNQPLGILFPNNYVPKNKILPIAAGHYNQLCNFLFMKTISDIKELFPIRLKKIDKYFKVGPFVGILTTNSPKGFRGNRRNYIDLIKMGMKTGVLVFIFTAESLNIEKKEVDGYFYLPAKKIWIKKKMSLPDVVYNRICSKKEENKQTTKDAIAFIRKENIPYFNYQFFDKWTLNEWMKKTSDLRGLVPDTLPLTLENLKKMLNMYSMVYLKPIHGKAGIGFFKIEKRNNSFVLTYQDSRTANHMILSKISTLWKNILSISNQKNYIIQRGIKLKNYYGKPYDIRVLVQKNGEGKWKVSGIGTRIAGEKSITTHVPRGGHIETPVKVLNYSFGKYAADWEDAITSISVDMANHIEKHSGNNLGEISLDLGIDEDNRLWFFEANSKPMKFDEPDIRYTSLLRLMQYFRYLSDFT